MSIVLGPTQYGKAETRVVRIVRDTARHEIRDVNVSTSLRGQFSDAYLSGDQSQVLPTDTQKNTCFAHAKEKGIGQIEEYALGLARHFVDDIEPVRFARVEVDEYAWERVRVDGTEHDHTWVRKGQETRTTAVTVDGSGEEQRTWVVSGLKDLVVLKSTGSEFWGFLKDAYTTLEETTDRIMATSLIARWRYSSLDIDWDEAYAGVRQLLLSRFASVHSYALQQTLWEMARGVLEAYPQIAEIRLSAPNKHHFVFDLAPFGMDNPNEVFHAADRPYGLIQASAVRDDAAEAGPAWDTGPAFA